jgi:hypothetical protein
MKEHRPVRIIKRDERERAALPAEALAEESPASSERKLKSVINGWVREHHERTEEYRRLFTDLLKEAGFRPPRAASRA